MSNKKAKGKSKGRCMGPKKKTKKEIKPHVNKYIKKNKTTKRRNNMSKEYKGHYKSLEICVYDKDGKKMAYEDWDRQEVADQLKMHLELIEPKGRILKGANGEENERIN